MSENINNASNGGLIGLIILCLLGCWAYTAWFKPDVWIGTYELPTTNAIQHQEFDSQIACFNWLKSPKYDGTYNHECGKNCTPPETEMAVFVCEETLAL